MAISKVILNGVTQIDLTQDTVNAASSLSGVIGHGADGESFTGSYVAPPIFTVTWDSNWETISSITCDKTYQECFALYNNRGF